MGGGGAPHPEADAAAEEGGGPQPEVPLATEVSPPAPPLSPIHMGTPHPDRDWLAQEIVEERLFIGAFN